MGTILPTSSEAAAFCSPPSALVGGVAENFELRLHELQISAALLLNLAVKGYKLPGLETVAQISGVEPDALQAASALAGRHLKNGHAAGAEQARGADFGDDRGHLSRAQFGNSTRIDAVLVAKGQVMKQIVDGTDALGAQHFGQTRADALYILDRGGQLEHLRNVSRRRR